MKKLFKIFTAALLALGFSSLLNACNVKSPEAGTAVDVSVEEVTTEAATEAAAHEAGEDHKCGDDHKCGEGKCGQE